MSMFGRQRFVVLLLPRHRREESSSSRQLPVTGTCSHHRRSTSPWSPDCVGGLGGGFPERARHTDGTLRWSVHVLGHACLAGLGRLDRRRRRRSEYVLGAGRALEPSKAAAEMSHKLGAGGGMHRRGDRRR